MYEYLRPVAAKYGTLFLKSEFEQFVASITANQIAELAIAYRLIVDSHEAARILEWSRQQWKVESNKEEQVQDLFPWQIGRLFMLFDELADSEIGPFDSRDVTCFDAEEPKRDWSKLPRHLQYLIPAAEEFGGTLSESAILETLDNLDQSKVAELTRIAKRILENKDVPKIEKWMNTYKLNEHPESSRIYGLMLLLDLGNYEFE